MYVSDLGASAILLALLFAIYTPVAAVAGALRQSEALVASARRATLAVAAFLLLASGALVASFLLHDFGVSYVAQHSSLSMPWYYVTAAFYGGQEGSLLYWALTLALFSAIFVMTSRRAPAALVPYVLATLMAIEAFFLVVLATVSSPFVRLAHPPADGVGLNPLLMDPGMLLHPPLLLMGYMSFSLPFAFAVAAMITGRLDSEWLRALRRWMLAAWTIQSAGLLMGAWWAYHVLGWGGYWGWDPVENAALLPWLTATAFLHSTMVQERRGMLKVWNLALVIASFALSIFGTFEVRSGVISSVHSFAYSTIGSYFLAFLALVIVFSLGLFLFRLPRLRAEQEFDSVVSREGIFLVNNLLLVGIAFATLWGTLFPLISAAVRHEEMSVGAPFYNQVTGPLFLLLLLAMGIGPLLAWRRTSFQALRRNLGLPALLAALCAAILPLLGVPSLWANVAFAVCSFTGSAILYELWRGVRVRHRHGESYVRALLMLFARYRRRYGGYLVHLGLLILAVGVIGSHFFQQQSDATLKPGQQVSIAGYQLVYLGNIEDFYPEKDVVVAQFQIWQHGQLLRYIYPGRQIYHNFSDQPASMISITTYGLTDLYVFLEDWQGAAQATIHIYVNPLTVLVWFGGLVLILGGVVCWWPEPPAPLRSGRLARSLTIAVAEATTASDRPPVQASQALTDPVTGEASAQEKAVVASAQAVERAATSPTPGPSDSRSREPGEEVSQ
ncbi:c-type cytochrome biogenesis protein CcmF [Thermogemmatispora aurantia]|uniref:C-type cytochrome biogenesis protein CcmF n=2 Tax=Thermogemmatispora TaxID=768669 RepID=A0A5J4K7W7_9CHLR|nr:heme lyase CcmF/NrfE family subunit [Thermogemmatispora aurantia]GER82790.1 c-type cytochrome biogenesis protein CcmF [Thermogemmatispora aurantia]